MKGGSAKYISFALDTRGTPEFDYYVDFVHDGRGGLRGRILDKGLQYEATTHGYRFAKRKGACVNFKAKRIKPIQQVVRWTVFSGYQSKRICRRACFDSTFPPYRHPW